MTKFLSDSWMVDNGFVEPVSENVEWWSDHVVENLGLSHPVTVSFGLTFFSNDGRSLSLLPLLRPLKPLSPRALIKSLSSMMTTLARELSQLET